eukprot:TRINITY_DN3657_c1_g2_i1.p1 TRINITY_DN3657_c1_g2~~TRINITY_DN3657_c1_g2_i1.p1  ORF type:complete len:289 (+),score=59.63 TRINITY_DN3657_c1_g2_i1:41-907(+)
MSTPSSWAPSEDEIRFHGSLAMSSWKLPKVAAECAEQARPGYSSEEASEYLDSKETLLSKVKVLAKLIKKSKDTVVYTGAGISTASGIGDYASKAKDSVAPHRRGTGGTINRLEVQPTYSHHAIAALEKKGLVRHWLQQNHDRLAQKAGFPQSKLNEIHGAWGDDKNQVKMMDDTLRDDLHSWMINWAKQVSLCIAVGTSLCGMCSDCVAQQAANNNSLVIITLTKTPMDSESCLRIWSTVDQVFELLSKELKVKVPNSIAAAAGNEWVNRHARCKYNTPKRKASDPM